MEDVTTPAHLTVALVLSVLFSITGQFATVSQDMQETLKWDVPRVSISSITLLNLLSLLVLLDCIVYCDSNNYNNSTLTGNESQF